MGAPCTNALPQQPRNFARSLTRETCENRSDSWCAIAEHRVQLAGEPAGQRHDGNLLLPPRGNARRPVPQRHGARIAEAEHMEVQVAREPFLRALQLVQNIVESRIDTAAWTSNQRIRAWPAL